MGKRKDLRAQPGQLSPDNASALRLIIERMITEGKLPVAIVYDDGRAYGCMLPTATPIEKVLSIVDDLVHDPKTETETFINKPS